MDRSIDDDALDAAAEDPPLVPLAGAVLGILLAGGGILATLASLVTALPLPVDPYLPIVAGVVLFIISMLQWSPDVGTE